MCVGVCVCHMLWCLFMFVCMLCVGVVCTCVCACVLMCVIVSVGVCIGVCAFNVILVVW